MFSSDLDVRHSLIIVCMTLVAILMAPITWYLWIYTGSANANFYFAMTMVFNVAQVRKIDKKKHQFIFSNFLDISCLGFTLCLFKTKISSQKWYDNSTI